MAAFFCAALGAPGAGPGGNPAAAQQSGTVELPGGVTLPSGAVAAPGQVSDNTALDLVAGVSAVGELAAIPAGLEFRLAPGWKTYWRSPGDAGYPVTVDWSGSRNLASAEFDWPAPHRFSLFGLDTFGYADRVIFPVTLTPERVGEPLHVEALVSYLVCEQVCIPGEKRLVLDLPSGPAQPSPAMQDIGRFAAQVPDDGAAHGLALEAVAVSGGGDAPSLDVTARSEFPFVDPDLIVEGPRGFSFAAPRVRLSDEDRVARFTVPVSVSAEAGDLARTRLTLTLVDAVPSQEGAEARRGLEATLTPAPPPDSVAGGLLPVLALALLGGLILNLMPCVLPVLSLKLLGVVGHGGGEARRVRLSFLASAAGVIAAFLVLAAALAAVKAAGIAVGWGIQFQQPLFLAFMLLLLTLFACNLWGWFDIRLPGWLGDAAIRGHASGERHGLAGHFATGAFATLLATPCSAPFLGTAVGFALAGTMAELFAVFLALGIGLALPYLLVAAVPALATALPRPGRWMAVLRRVLGVALAATALWLLGVLAVQIGGWAATLAGVLLAAIVGMLWLRHRFGRRLDRPARAGVAVSALALLLLIAAPPEFGPALGPVPAPAVEAGAGAAGTAAAVWQSFDEARIDRLVREGKVVLVDVTADWCITCQVNKALVLDAPEIVARLGDSGVVAMRADWTRPDPAIAGYLASFGRYGIPFNAVYGPAAPQGLPLPELLSVEAVLAALDRAAGGAPGAVSSAVE